VTKPFGNNAGDNAGGDGGKTVGGSSVLGKLIGGGQQPVGRKEKIPAYVDSDILNRLRNTIVALQSMPDEGERPHSLSSFVEAAVLAAVVEAEAEFNSGRPFPQRRRAQLKSGPPISA
jgi:hypothetical protein